MSLRAYSPAMRGRHLNSPGRSGSPYLNYVLDMAYYLMSLLNTL